MNLFEKEKLKLYIEKIAHASKECCTGLHRPVNELKPVLTSAPVAEIKASKQKAKKLKVKRG